MLNVLVKSRCSQPEFVPLSKFRTGSWLVTLTWKVKCLKSLIICFSLFFRRREIEFALAHRSFSFQDGGHSMNDYLKGQCQLQCIARSNNAWRPFYWQSNSCFGFQSVIYFNHPMVILAHFNRIVTTKHQRNVYNRYLLTFHHFQGKM